MNILSRETLPVHKVRGESRWASSWVPGSSPTIPAAEFNFGRRDALRRADSVPQRQLMAIKVHVGKVSATAARSQCAGADGRMHRILSRGSCRRRIAAPGKLVIVTCTGLDSDSVRRAHIRIQRPHGLLPPDPSTFVLARRFASTRRRPSSASVDVQRVGGFDASARLPRSMRNRRVRLAVLPLPATAISTIVRIAARSGLTRTGG